MPRVITGQDDRCGPWMTSHTDSHWTPGSGSTIGLEDADGQLLAVCGFCNFNSANIEVHLSAVEGKRWMNREFLWYIFYYPFVQLSCRRVTAVIASCNKQACGFIENLGFTLEATLKDAHPEGDLLVYCFFNTQPQLANYLKGPRTWASKKLHHHQTTQQPPVTKGQQTSKLPNSPQG